MRAVADAGHLHPAGRQQLNRRRADGARRAVDQDALSAADLGLADGGEGVVGTLGGRSRLRVGQRRRNPGQRSGLTDAEVLRVRTAGRVVVPEDPVTDVEARHCGANTFDLSGELVAEDRHSRARQPSEGPGEERRAASEPAVGAIHGRRVHLDEQLVVPHIRQWHVHHLHHTRRAVPGVDRGQHASTIAAPVVDDHLMALGERVDNTRQVVMSLSAWRSKRPENRPLESRVCRVGPGSANRDR